MTFIAVVVLLLKSLSKNVDTQLDATADYFLLASFVLVILFTITYGLFFQFWKRPVGTAVFLVFLSWSVLVGYALIKRLLLPDDFIGEGLARFLVWGFVAFSLLLLFSLLIRAWVKGGSSASRLLK